ncbi:MAG: hypothetical protein LBK67_12435 [Coriobacteriales bacterium]|jgi:hypothetical protein|nr:hypothetical protein [Coriobacteriales bacterium]
MTTETLFEKIERLPYAQRQAVYTVVQTMVDSYEIQPNAEHKIEPFETEEDASMFGRSITRRALSEVW